MNHAANHSVGRADDSHADGGTSLPAGPFTITSDAGVSTTVSVLAEVIAIIRRPERYGHVAAGLAVRGRGDELEIVRDGFRGFGVALDVNPATLVQHLFFGMTADPIGPCVPRGHQPWQMPRLTWEALQSSGSVAFGVVPGVAASDAAVQWIEAAFRDHFGYGHNGPPYGTRRDTNARYEVHVAYALACGRDVPVAYVDDAKRDFGKSDLRWAAALIDRPELRGRVTPEQWQTLHALVERSAGITLTKANAQAYFDVVSRFGDIPDAIDVDDALFEAELLPALAPASRGDTATAGPSGLDDQIGRLVDSIAQYRERLQRKALQKERTARRISLRELNKQLGEVVCSPTQADVERAWRIVLALRERSIDVLCDVLDTADDSNPVSKAFARMEFGLRTAGIRAADRRRAIFAYCGMDEATQADWEARREKARNDRALAQEAQRRADRSTSMVSAAKVRLLDGSVTTWKELIDQRIAVGYRQIRVIPRGAVPTYWLTNPATGEVLGLKAANGTLDYARSVLAQQQTTAPLNGRRAA